jgi:uncharacterized protein with beta-barrel porin domain
MAGQQPALGAVFQALPDSNFTVNGTTSPKNPALTTAGAELHLNAIWTAMVKFDGEFGSGCRLMPGRAPSNIRGERSA